jgi:hypothetical protein
LKAWPAKRQRQRTPPANPLIFNQSIDRAICEQEARVCADSHYCHHCHTSSSDRLSTHASAPGDTALRRTRISETFVRSHLSNHPVPVPTGSRMHGRHNNHCTLSAWPPCSPKQRAAIATRPPRLTKIPTRPRSAHSASASTLAATITVSSSNPCTRPSLLPHGPAPSLYDGGPAMDCNRPE